MLGSKDTFVPVDQAQFQAEADLQESRDLHSAPSLWRISRGEQRRERKGGITDLLEAQREGDLVGQAKPHPLPFKVGLTCITHPMIFLTHWPKNFIFVTTGKFKCQAKRESALMRF